MAGTGATGRHRVSAPQHQLRVPGRAILREVLAAYQEPFRQAILERGTRVLILRFTASTSDAWAARVPAAVISAEQKVRMFTALGARVDSLAIPDTTEPGELVDRLAAANEASDIAAIIVQTPPPPRLRDALDLIDPTKDIDALGADSPAWPAPPRTGSSGSRTPSSPPTPTSPSSAPTGSSAAASSGCCASTATPRSNSTRATTCASSATSTS